MYFQYKQSIWGRYGYCDAFNVQQDYRSQVVNGLNQTPMIIAIENYRTGMPWATFMANQNIQSSFNTAGFKTYAQAPMVTESSYEGQGFEGFQVVDGDTTTTRWSSNFSDPQWFVIDYGAPKTFNQVTMYWETACARSYKLQISTDGISWKDIYSTTNGTGGVETVVISAANARYLKFLGLERATQWGYSMYELKAEYSHFPAAWASSEVNGNTAANSIDGNTATLWESTAANNQWLISDFGSLITTRKLYIAWGAGYAKSFNILVSKDGQAWTKVYSTTRGTGGLGAYTFASTSMRFAKIDCISRANTQNGFSIKEISTNNISGAPAPGLPDDTFTLGNIYSFPNPARENAKPTIHVEVGVADSVEVTIYRIDGTLIHSVILTGQPLIIGNDYAYEYTWDTTNDVASGVYIYHVKAAKTGSDDITATKKLALVK
jgi:hypothetical protein